MLFSRFDASIVATIGLLLLCLGKTASAQPSASPTDTSHYAVDADIRPASGRFDVTVDQHYVPKRPTDTLRFLLHENLHLQKITSPAIDGYETSSWKMGGRDVHTKIVTISLNRTATPSNPVPLTWAYEGRLTTDQFPSFGGPVVSSHWVELPVESMWVPVHASLRTRFTFDATIDVPKGYEVVSTGTIRKQDGDWHISSQIPTPDVPLVISDQMQSTTRETNGIPITVYHAGAPDAVHAFVAERGTDILGRYAQRFETGREADHLRVTLAPVERASPSSYARPGLIALRHGVEADTSLYDLLAHETAHLWWTDAHNPMSRHNFLNESFAEYETWRAVQAAYGADAIAPRIEKARQKAKSAPSFFDWTPKHDGMLSYNKGPLLLQRLHDRIGDDDYLNFLQRLQRNEVSTLEEMIATLRAVTSDETARWFKSTL